MNTSADLYFIDGCGRCSLGGTPQCKVNTWRDALLYMREILRLCGLHETCKWGVACYMHHDKNILLLTAFKEYAALNFFNGASLSDTKRLLNKAGEHSQSGRMFKFNDISDIKKHEKAIVNLIKEAMRLEEAGKITTAKPATIKLPEELVKVFKELPALETAFYALTPGRQRAYLIYFTGAKQSETRMARIEKYIPQILKGIGFHDAYKRASNKK
jgi:uncharacterized protein YdeI (YjbR/CyaY-like superfamily)